ncbi:hypothetical protein Cgig2_005129 [Carnegiea gigantea]|uniref:AMP-dependent synthetase/ligase domain-containing protein n=1 Tax=Carnegiea gigantea TaxID=171969 RepID=A0A9Q1KEU5_9CARY|nr:hypothetical protein Cgig2_005129 [Carnegiea gigantea]
MEQLLRPGPANSPPLTPLGLLDRAATAYGEAASIVYNNTEYTWSQTHRRCLQIASSLSSIGIRRRNVVSVLAPNIPAAYESHFAVPMCGAILNNINTRLDPRTVSVLLRHSESKLIFVDFQSFSLLTQAFSFLPAFHPRPKVVLVEDEEEGKQNDRKALKGDVFATYEEMMNRGDPNFSWIRPESDWDPIVLNYTSGTTSSPKGVVHCHRGAFINVMNGLTDWSVSKRAVYLWTLPMFHANGWSYTWGTAAVGATNICLRKFDSAAIYAAIDRHKVTHMCGAPVVLNMLSNLPNAAPLGHPAAVVARPDEYWGETPCAFVSLKEGVEKKPSERELIEFCRERLPHYMVPKTVVFIEELPKTSTGKIQKFVLREMAKNLRPLSSNSRASRL